MGSSVGRERGGEEERRRGVRGKTEREGEREREDKDQLHNVHPLTDLGRAERAE